MPNKFEKEPEQDKEFSEEEIRFFEAQRKRNYFAEYSEKEWDTKVRIDPTGDKYERWFKEKIREGKKIVENRKKKLFEAVERIKKEVPQDKLEHIKAILLFGSMARGDATPESDLDLFIVLDDQKFSDLETFKKITDIIDEEVPDVRKEYGYRAITNERSGGVGLITRKNARDLEKLIKPPAWEFLYAKDENEQAKLDEIFKRAQRAQNNEK